MTSLNFRCASTDGYGDRDDIALARDKGWNSRKAPANWRDIVDYNWAESLQTGTHIEEIVKRMIELDNMISCYEKNAIYFPSVNDYGDDYTIHDAVTNVCIDLGLDDEEFAPYLRIDGNIVNIRLQ